MPDHPLVPGGDSAVENGPWHYGADYISVYFKGETSSLAKLVPRPFTADGGLCMAYICEIVSVGETGADTIARRPDRTVYHEAAVGISCKFKDRQGIFFPVMWVTTEWSLLRGILNGYQKRLADGISMTRLHPLNPGLRPVGPGTEFGGFCVKGPEATLSVEVTVEHSGTPKDLPSFGATFGMRRFPQTYPGQGSVEEAVEILKSNSRSSDIWLGNGSLKTVLELGKIEQKGGAIYRSGFTISGAKVLKA